MIDDSERPPRAKEHWPRVLIADDESDIRRVVGWLVRFAWHDAQILTAVDGTTAFEFLLDFRPDLLITDIRMPGLDGRVLCRAVREDPRLRNLKILVVTGYDQAAVREEMMECVDGYLAKPFEPRELREMIVRMVGSRPRRPSPVGKAING